MLAAVCHTNRDNIPRESGMVMGGVMGKIVLSAILDPNCLQWT